MGEDSDSSPRSSRAGTVAAGILASRLLGFVRERAVAFLFGVGPHVDVLRMALRGPNILQNLLGEGSLSAAFIPVYSRMLAEGRPRDAGRFAGAIFGLLLAGVAALVLLGVALAEPIVTLLAPGFVGDAARVAAGELPVDRFRLTVTAVRIIFPMTGFLVLSAWCLGVLNSHRRFFLPYFAPVLWNLAILGVLIAGASLLVVGVFEPGAVEQVSATTRNRLVLVASWGALLGGVVQFLVQLPLVIRVMRGFRPSLRPSRVPGVREALGAFGPVVAGRGVYQLSAWLDLVLASLLAAGAVGAMGYAIQLYVLPVSLFGLSVAAAELPELSRVGDAERAAFVARLGASLRQMAFLVVPTMIGYLAFGYLVVGTLFRTGEFDRADNWLVWLVLAGYSLGLPATTAGRLLQNAFFALGDTRTPARIAVLRVTVSVAVAVPAMLLLDRLPVASLAGLAPPPGEAPLFLGAVGLAVGSAAGAWVELTALLRRLGARLGRLALPAGTVARMGLLALAAAVPGAVLWWWLPALHPALEGLCVVGLYAVTYLGLAHLLGMSEAGAWVGRWLGRGRGG